MNDEVVILITVDSLRRDYCGFMGYPRDTTPYLDSLADRSFVGENTYSNGRASAQAFRSILTSTYPLEFDDYGYLAEGRPCIADILQSEGVECLGFNASNPYLSRYFWFERNFSHFTDFIPESNDSGGTNRVLTRYLDLWTDLKQRIPKLFDFARAVKWKYKYAVDADLNGITHMSWLNL